MLRDRLNRVYLTDPMEWRAKYGSIGLTGHELVNNIEPPI
jgi:hypothetical protein